MSSALPRRREGFSHQSGDEAAAGYASAQYVTPGDPRALADAVLAVRDRWSEFRDAAVADAGTAARRHSPEGYRGQVAELLGALTATR